MKEFFQFEGCSLRHMIPKESREATNIFCISKNPSGFDIELADDNALLGKSLEKAQIHPKLCSSTG